MSTPASKNTYPKRSPSHPGRVDLVPQEFDNLIEDHGVRVRITPTMLCPNRTSLVDTNHALDCPVCGDQEVVELTDACIEDWALIQGVKLDKEAQVQGIYDLKDAQLTTRAGVRLYYWYKIEIIDFASVYNELIARGAGDVDKVRYSPAAACDTPHFLLDKTGKQYRVNEDYRVEGQTVRWLSANRPTGLYSFTYPVLPTFRVIELVNENRYYYTGIKSPVKTPVQLPQRAVIRWDYLSKRSGSNELRE